VYAFAKAYKINYKLGCMQLIISHLNFCKDVFVLLFFVRNGLLKLFNANGF